MEYCWYIWTGAPSCYLEMLDKLQNGYLRLLVLHLLSLLNPWVIVGMQLAQVFSIGITSVNGHLNCLNWFLFFILMGGLIVILIDYMIFRSLFLDVTKIFMSPVSFLTQLNSEILCL